MSFYWDSNLKESLRRILLGLTVNKTLNIYEIARQLNIELCSNEDKSNLRHKIYSLKKTDKDLFFLMSRKGRYFIAEYSTDRIDMHYRYRNISATYKTKSDDWKASVANGKKKDNEYEQLVMKLFEEGNQ